MPAEHHLLHNLVLFGRVLRGLGLDVNPGRMIDLARALRHVQIGIRSDVYHASRSLLVHRRDDIPLFDEAFEMFWHKPLAEWSRVEIKGRRVRRAKPEPLVVPPAIGASSSKPLGEDAQERTVIEVTKTYSAREELRKRDFSELTETEIENVRRLMADSGMAARRAALTPPPVRRGSPFRLAALAQAKPSLRR